MSRKEEYLRNIFTVRKVYTETPENMGTLFKTKMLIFTNHELKMINFKYNPTYLITVIK